MFKFSLLLLLLWQPLLAQTPPAPEPLPITPLIPVSAQLNNQIPALTYQFETEAGMQWSFTAATTIGDIDPVLRLLDDEGNELLANDNETPDSPNARLEGWIAPADGEYQIEVGRAGGARARTGGRVSLLLIPGYSQVISNQTAVLAPQDALGLGVIPLDTIGLTLTLSLNFDEALWLRANPFWVLRMTPAGWSLHHSAEELSADTLIAEDEVDLSGDALMLEITANRLIFWRDGAAISEVDIDDITLLPEEETRLTLIAPGENPVTLDQATLTAAFYADPTVAVPPTAPGERLYDYDQDPIRAVNELEELELVPAGGGLIMALPRGLIETQMSGFSSYPLAMGADLQDFVLSFDAQFRASGAGSACGMTFRVVDSDDFAAVLFSMDGNVYLLEYTDGAMTANSIALATPNLNTGLLAYNHILLVGSGDEITLYVNGRRVGGATMQPRPGVMQIALVLNEDVYTLCTLDSIWIWRLDNSVSSE